MFALRRLLAAHRLTAALIVAAALALRLLVPAGYMISSDHGQVGVTVCSNMAMPASTAPMMGMPDGMADHGKTADHGKPDMPCAFSSLSAQALGGLDAILAVAAIAFVVASGLRRRRLHGRPLNVLVRPPSRAPPARP